VSDLKCVRCGVELKGKQKKWCSVRCQKTRFGRECVVCSVDLPKGKRKVCSHECLLKMYSPGNFVPCEQCGITYKRKGFSRYCSDACRKVKAIPRMREQEFLNTLKKFGITKDEYNKIFELQDGKCAICNCPESAILNGKVKRLAIDHCHQTNFIRGLLCQRCNMGIGQFNDNCVLLDNALEYLIAGDIKAGTMTRMGSRNDNA
jgi:hypothetical protein